MERMDGARSGGDGAVEADASTWWITASTDGFVVMWRWLVELAEAGHLESHPSRSEITQPGAAGHGTRRRPDPW